MATESTQLTVEITLTSKDALVAYQDTILDRTVSLRLDHKTGALTAVVDDAGTRRNLGCGTVSTTMAERLKRFQRILWSRLEGEDIIAVSEVSLEHA